MIYKPTLKHTVASALSIFLTVVSPCSSLAQPACRDVLISSKPNSGEDQTTKSIERQPTDLRQLNYKMLKALEDALPTSSRQSLYVQYFHARGGLIPFLRFVVASAQFAHLHVQSTYEMMNGISFKAKTQPNKFGALFGSLRVSRRARPTGISENDLDSIEHYVADLTSLTLKILESFSTTPAAGGQKTFNVGVIRNIHGHQTDTLVVNLKLSGLSEQDIQQFNSLSDHFRNMTADDRKLIASLTALTLTSGTENTLVVRKSSRLPDSIGETNFRLDLVNKFSQFGDVRKLETLFPINQDLYVTERKTLAEIASDLSKLIQDREANLISFEESAPKLSRMLTESLNSMDVQADEGSRLHLKLDDIQTRLQRLAANPVPTIEQINILSREIAAIETTLSDRLSVLSDQLMIRKIIAETLNVYLKRSLNEAHSSADLEGLGLDYNLTMLAIVANQKEFDSAKTTLSQTLPTLERLLNAVRIQRRI